MDIYISTCRVSQKKWCVSLLQQQANAPFFWDTLYQPSSLSTIESIDHQAYLPLSLSTIEPIRPSSQSTIEPIDLWSSFATFKPFGLFVISIVFPRDQLVIYETSDSVGRQSPKLRYFHCILAILFIICLKFGQQPPPLRAGRSFHSCAQGAHMFM